MRITCHLTNETFDVTLPEYKDLTKQYGNEENLQNFYIQHRFADLLRKGLSVDKIIELHQLQIPDVKKLKEVVKFHKKTDIVSSIEVVKASHTKSDRMIKSFLKSFAKTIEAVGIAKKASA